MNPVTSASLERAYRRHASYYDFVFGPILQPGRETAIEQLNCKAGDRVLEVGVGTGSSLNLYPTNVRIVGIDLSEPMLERAGTKVEEEDLTHVEALLKMDAQNMNFADNSFDKVVAMYVASVVPDPKKLVSEIRRVCKPGGEIVFLNHFENEHPVVRNLEALVQPLAKHLGFHPDFPLPKFLEETDFQATAKIPVNLMGYWTVLVGRNEPTKT